MNENEWDKLLKIHTTGTDNADADQYRYPYEPTRERKKCGDREPQNGY